MINLKDKHMFIVIALFTISMIWGCASTTEQNDQISEYKKWQELAAKSRGYSPTSRDRTLDVSRKRIETIGQIEGQVQKKRPLPNRKISLKMHLTEVPVLLRALARAVHLNIMINESVQGKISLNVNNAEWNRVFEGILKSQALDYEWEGDIIRIVTIEDRERNLKNLEAEEKILSKKRALETNAALVTKIIPVDFSDAEKLRGNIEKVLSSNTSSERKGTVLVDTHTNSLIVQATPTEIAQIVPMITELDRPTAQILIEAFIVETSSRTARELGVAWGGLLYDSSANSWLAAQPMSALSGYPDTNPSAGAMSNFPADLSSASQSGTGMSLGLIEQGAQGILALELSALEEAGKLNILSSPSITTLDNAKAVIQSGDEIPIPVQTSDTVNVIYKEALLTLEVTPHVIQDNALKLEILTTKNEIDNTRTALDYPTIVAKKAQTNVILFDGQTTVIGGLKKNTDQDGEAGVPGLKDIPVLGYLFKNQGRSKEQQELLIFITPHILKANTAPMASQEGAPDAP